MGLDIFDLQLYGVGHMIKDHSDSERGNRLPSLHGLLFLINSKVSFICTILDRKAFDRLAGMRNNKGSTVRDRPDDHTTDYQINDKIHELAFHS